MRYWIYIHTCPNGKKYVGCTKQVRPELRWKEGRGYVFNVHFSQAIQKYGWDNIKHEAWELTSESEMYYAEKYLIAYYCTTKSKLGYNRRTGGMEGSKKTEPRKPVSEETREKLRNASFHKDPEYREKLRKANSKSHSDPEYRRKLSEAHKGKLFSKEHRQHCAEANRRTANDSERLRKIKNSFHRHLLEDPEFAEKHYRDCQRRARNLKESAQNRPRFKIRLPDGTIREMTKANIVKCFINKGKEFEYVS